MTSKLQVPILRRSNFLLVQAPMEALNIAVSIQMRVSRVALPELTPAQLLPASAILGIRIEAPVFARSNKQGHQRQRLRRPLMKAPVASQTRSP